MNRWHVLTGIVVLCAMMLVQSSMAQNQAPSPGTQPYEPAVPPPSMNFYGGAGGYGYNAGGTTPAGSAMNGMANAISAKGNYNLSTSAAAVNMTQAQRNEIQNHQQYESTYFQMREENQQYQKAEAGPPPTEEQLARLAREGVPQPPSAGQVNSVTGQINWPDVLQQDSFASQREALDQLSAKKATHGSLTFQDQMNARKDIEAMFAQLKSQIQEIPPQDYMTSRDFLQSMIYAVAHTELD